MDNLVEQIKDALEIEDLNERKRILKTFADQGNARAQYEMHRCEFGLHIDTGVELDENTEGFKYLKMSAEQGYARAVLSICMAYQNGKINGKGFSYKILKDIFKAVSYYKKLDTSTVEADWQMMYDTGMRIIDDNFKNEIKDALLGTNKQQGVKVIEAIADAGQVNALHVLGELYSTENDFVTQNKQKAYEYYKKAADKGFMDAQFAVFQMYNALFVQGGQIIDEKTEGFKYLVMAAEQGHVQAGIMAVTAFAAGGLPGQNFMYQIPEDKNRAIKLFSKIKESDVTYDTKSQYETVKLIVDNLKNSGGSQFGNTSGSVSDSTSSRSSVSGGTEGDIKVSAGSSGCIQDINCYVGQRVRKADTVAILSSMGIEVPIVAVADGIVASINVYIGQSVEVGTVIMTLNGNSSSTSGNVTKKSEGCYIATAVYGDYDAPQVMVLRRFRDEVLLTHWWGKLFVKFYYFVSPPLARRMKGMSRVNKKVRALLDSIVNRLK